MEIRFGYEISDLIILTGAMIALACAEQCVAPFRLSPAAYRIRVISRDDARINSSEKIRVIWFIKSVFGMYHRH
jgi:hypothetical protein